MSIPTVYWLPKAWTHPPKGVLPPDTKFITLFKQWVFKHSKYNQLGLYHDDILCTYPDVMEAVRRLPMHLKQERDWRSIRAIQLDVKNIILPKEEWISYEEDVTRGRYLQPYLREVRQEIEERNQWIATH